MSANKEVIGISIDKEILKKIESRRKGIPRSAYIEMLIKREVKLI